MKEAEKSFAAPLPLGPRCCRLRAADCAVHLILAGGYFLSAKLGLALAFVHANATAVWPPTGIALAAFLILGRRVWPGIFLGAFAANATTAGSWATSLAIATGNTLEGLVGAFLIERFAGGREVFHRPQDIFKFAVLAGLLSTAVSATVGVTSLSLGGFAEWDRYGAVWLTWWLGDAGGALVVAPCLILWAADLHLRWCYGKAMETAFFFLTLVFVGLVVFAGLFSPMERSYPLDFLCLPLLIWSAFRLGQRETATASLILAGLAIWGTLHGLSPFAMKDQNASLLLLQAFMGVATMVSLAVAAVVAQHKLAKNVLRETHSALELEVEERTAALLKAVAKLESEVTGRRQAEKALELKTEELLRSNAELDQFATVVSHELQEPVRKILAFGEILKTIKADPGSEEWQYAQRMGDAARRMERLIHDILSLSRVMTNAKPLESVDLNETIKDVAADFKDRISQAGGKMTAGPLPILKADGLQMSELFGNLVSNAYKFRKKEEPLRINVTSGPVQKGYIEIRVEDNGIGFEEQYLDRIFKPFQRLHRRGEYEGSGMGLAICQRILLRHGGVISAKSRPGNGSVFIVTLPA